MRIYTLLIGLVLTVAFVACSDEQSNKELAEAEDLLLETYLAESGIDQMTDVIELLDTLEIYYIEREEGPGRLAETGDAVSIRFSVYTLEDSTLLYSNIKETRPYILTLGSSSTYSLTMPANVPGFHTGLGMMNEGGKATFIIASDQAYGSYDYVDNRAYVSIPKYTPLRFEVQITDLSIDERD